MRIVVIDGQGGGIGARLVAAIGQRLPEQELIAVGANAVATEKMMKAGAKKAATGDNAAAVACRDADIIVGPLGIAIADSMMGEITPKIALAVARSKAVRVLIPVGKCDNVIVGLSSAPLTDLTEEAVNRVIALVSGKNQPHKVD